MDADGLRMSAAMSFYGVLSLAPLLVVVVAVLGWWVDKAVIESSLLAQIGGVIGERGADLVKQALSSARQPTQGFIASAIALGILLAGATGVLAELLAAFERLWMQGSEGASPQKWWHAASLRLRGLAYILAFGFLLLVSLAISTALNLFTGWAGNYLPLEQIVLVLNEVVAFGICALLFLALMRLSSGPKPGLRYLLLGACFGAALFSAGKHVLAAYLSTAAIVSAYGAAGSLVVMLMWIYFSSALLLLAAACARALSDFEKERKDKRWAMKSTAAAATLAASSIHTRAA